MTTLLIEYLVADFGEWKGVFDADPLGRKDHGVTGHTIYQDPDDRNHFLLAMTFGSAEDARAFRDLPEFQAVWEMSGAGQSWVVEQTEHAAG